MARKSKTVAPPATAVHDWRTTDDDEVRRRKQRAETESFKITNLTPEHPVFSTFRIASPSGREYRVEVRDAEAGPHTCNCVDYQTNGLGTCKHVEAVFLQLRGRFKRRLDDMIAAGAGRTELVLAPDRQGLRWVGPRPRWPKTLAACLAPDGQVVHDDLEQFVGAVREQLDAGRGEVRISQEIAPWLESRHRTADRVELRREYERNVQAGRWPAQETRVPLFPYQRAGMLHLAFTERALLADEMGLGKTIQAIAACALLHRLNRVQRVLVVTPASLKTEWEEQIARFTELPCRLVFGGRDSRLAAYRERTFFTVVNYEQMLGDAPEVNTLFEPDVVILDEAQRIKNWAAKTSQAVKRLRSRYAFVLTGTPIENRIDELHSLMDFIDPSVLGPLFRFNREYYQLDDRGRPAGYRNLARLHEAVAPYLLRRRKADVETELPARTDRNHFVPLTPAQEASYADFQETLSRLSNIARRRPLTQQEQERMLRTLAMMRMVCDTLFILDRKTRESPKVDELERLLEECRANDAKVIVFSEWERMLELVRDACGRLGLECAWHTGSVPQQRRRGEINRFKLDPECRVFLSTDSGATGLNLQVASVVINCDLPWNPAKLEQRIARAWRKNQSRPVNVINLVAQNTIEHRMLETLAHKQALSDGVLDRMGDLETIQIRTGRQAFFTRLEQLIVPGDAVAGQPAVVAPARPVLPTDRPLGFSREAHRRWGGAVIRCEERFPEGRDASVVYVVVEQDRPEVRADLAAMHREYFADRDPLAPVTLEIIDRATEETLERLAAAGLIALRARAVRPLPAADRPPELSDAARARLTECRELMTRKLKLAGVLGAGGFDEEAAVAVKEAVLARARVLAVENRLAEPADLAAALQPPFGELWGLLLPGIRSFCSSPVAHWSEILRQLPAA